MAYDKVVDSAQLDADLKIVADAIRSKGGTTEPLEFPLGMKSAVESIQTGVTKPEQEKTIDITENGTTEVIPDSGKVLSKVTVNVDVESGGGSGEEFIGTKCYDFDSYRLSPKTVDARSLPDDNSIFGGYSYLFANVAKNPNGGFYAMMETVYLPKLRNFHVNILYNCGNLKNIYGDFTNVNCIETNAFYGCSSLEYAPYTPNITEIKNNAFYQCTSLKEYKFYKKLNSINGGAFNQCKNLLDIYVPWSEGEVSNAPWGATNATIHYNTVYDENHNPIV